ncbi:hypothetical protein NQD34_009429 [Periophthalmus magnuspinnatus]|nr:hypothetical protein NQD34_009429 [Periophthalmus magnuspinnatus]
MPTTSQQPLLTNEDTIHSSHGQDFQNDVNSQIRSEEDQTQETDDEEGPGCKIDQDAEDDDEDYEDYEETIVRPRHLNELTSLTDKTSPWTSILSDPDVVSLESIDTEISHGEKVEHLTTELLIKDSSCNASFNCEEDNKRDNISEKEESNTDEETPRTCESLHLKIQDKKPAFNSESEDEAFGASSSGIHNPISTEKIDDPQPKPPVIPEVPNFFLPPHQMEASMKAIRLAPSFSQSPVDLGPSAAPARGPRSRPNMSPSSLRKETDRIARIFAAHFDETQRN